MSAVAYMIRLPILMGGGPCNGTSDRHRFNVHSLTLSMIAASAVLTSSMRTPMSQTSPAYDFIALSRSARSNTRLPATRLGLLT